MALRRAFQVALRPELLGDDRQPVEVEEDDAAPHAGPGVDALRAHAEERPFPRLLPEVLRVAVVRGPRAQHVPPAERAVSLEEGAHGTGRRIPRRPFTASTG